MKLSQAQAVRFYERLAMIISNREGVDIKVISVIPKKEMQHDNQQEEKIHHGTQECKAM